MATWKGDPRNFRIELVCRDGYGDGDGYGNSNGAGDR